MKHTLPLAFLALLSTALSQQTPPQATGNSTLKTDAEGEIITLEEFQVTAQTLKDTYIAAEATSGTRTGEETINLPYSIQILTEEFINDFQLFSLEDQLAFVAGATTGGGVSRVRGFNVLTTRDGFQYAMSPTPTNTLQSEFIKGPLAALYGRAEPGGIVNRITRRPKIKPAYTFSATASTDSDYRLSLSATGPVLPGITSNKLYHYTYFESTHSEPSQQFITENNQYFGTTLLYMFQKTSSLSATFEYQYDNSPDASSGVTYMVGGTYTGDPSTNNYIEPTDATVGARDWTGIGTFNKYGPDAKRTRNYWGLNFLFEHRINPAWSLRIAMQTYSKDSYKERWAGASYFYEVSQRFSARDPYKQDQLDENIAAQTDLLGQFRSGKIIHKLLFAIDASYHKLHDYSYKLPFPLEQQLNAYQQETVYLSMANPRYENFDPSLVNSPRSLNDTDHQAYGAFASYRAFLFNSKLVAMGSLRYDYYTADVGLKSPSNSDNKTSDGDKFSYSTGLTCKLLNDQIVAYISVSSSFQPSLSVDKGTGSLVKPTDSYGSDIGIKGDILGNTLTYTLGLFTVTEKSPTKNENYDGRDDGTGRPEYTDRDKKRAKGAELQLTCKPIKSFILVGAFSYIDPEIIKAQYNAQSHVGQAILYTAKWNAAIACRYQPPFLKNFSIGASLTYRDEITTDYASATVEKQKSPSLTLVSAFASYDWKVGRLSNKIAINIKNLLDKEYYKVSSGRPADGISARLTYSLKY